MAKCRRCGAVFDYGKKDGVCPKCCFYNRPPGTPYHDDDWISSYNVEDNTYELPKSSAGADEERKIRSDSGFGRKVFRLAVAITCAVIILITVLVSIGNIRSGQWDFEVEEGTAKKLQEGMEIGDMTISTDAQGAVVLFKDGELPELPAEEKCVGIYLTDNESSLEYQGTDWERPYVYDGTYYRKLVYPAALDSKDKFDRFGMDFMSDYVSSYYNFEGMAVFFVDKDADTLTLCIPKQSVNNGNVSCDGVVDIELPVNDSAIKGE